MSKGQQFSHDMKQIFLNVIKFLEKEKFGSIIPLFNFNERLSSMLDISVRSVERLKSKMREIEHDMMEEKRKMDQEKQKLENQKLQMLGRLRNLRSRSSSSSSSSTISVTVSRSSQRLSNSGRSSITLTDQQQETIR
jgi:hypothetical protein